MFEIIIALIIGFAIGMRVSSWINAVVTKQILQDLGIKDQDILNLIKKDLKEEQQEEELEVVEVKLEQHQGQIFAYRKDNDQFLGQGSTGDALIEHISKRMNNVKLNISQEDGADLLQKNNT